MDKNLLFVLGTQRSGTTLLSRIMSSHPKLFIQNEISVEKVFTRNAEKQQILDNISAQLNVRHGQTADQLISSRNIDLLGIKDPQLTEHIDALRMFLPESKFIIIVRDARGVVNSYMDNKWGLGTNAYTGAQRWLSEVQLQKQFMQEAPDNFLLIRYEDLVGDLEHQLRRVCQFLTIEFDASMLEYHKQSAGFKANASNINTNKKPDLSFLTKWKRKLSNKQINLIECVAGDELINNGYELVSRQVKPSRISICYYQLHQMILGEIQIQYQLKRFWLKQVMKKYGLIKC